MVEEKEEKNIVYIGKKSINEYIDSVIYQIGRRFQTEVIIKARGGRNIASAVDVAEMSRRKFPDGSIIVGEVKIGSEEITEKETGRKKKVSIIEIPLIRK